MEIPGDYQIDDWSCRTVFKDFYDFLRLVCTKDIYNEDCLEFILEV